MIFLTIFSFTIIIYMPCASQTFTIHESDVNFRIEPGSRTCFFEKGRAGQIMEVFYQVIDGQHGDLDISFDVIDPKGVKIVSDYKKPENSIIMTLDVDGDYAFCMDNTFSLMNSKLVFVYVMMEDNVEEGKKETEISVVNSEGEETKHQEVLQWTGTDEDGELYYIDVEEIAEYMKRTLKHVLKARHLLDLHGAAKSRDSYVAFEDTFVVDVWSSFQISLMFIVGMLQVYMIKNLFKQPIKGLDNKY